MGDPHFPLAQRVGDEELSEDFFHSIHDKLPIGMARDSFDEANFNMQLSELANANKHGKLSPMKAAGASRATTSFPTGMDEVLFNHKTGLRHGGPLRQCRGERRVRGNVQVV